MYFRITQTIATHTLYSNVTVYSYHYYSFWNLSLEYYIISIIDIGLNIYRTL